MAGRAAHAIAAADAVVAADAAGALTRHALLVLSGRARKCRAAFAGVAPSVVLNNTFEAVAVRPIAPVPMEEATAVALDAVLTVLAGAVLACLAGSNGRVVVCAALAAVGDVDPDEPAGPAGEGFRTPALE